MDLALLDRTLADLGEPAYRARQVWEWTARGASAYDEMTTLPKALRSALSRTGTVLDARGRHRAHVARRHAEDALQDARRAPVETVLMRYRDGRRSLCLLVSVGLPAHVHVLRNGRDAVRTNLTASEILDQALHFRRAETVNYAVYMGMGEPFLNVDAVLASAARLPDVGITHRRTTISTVGWLPGLRRLRRRGRAPDPPRALDA